MSILATGSLLTCAQIGCDISEIEYSTLQDYTHAHFFFVTVSFIHQGCFTGTGSIIWLPQCYMIAPVLVKQPWWIWVNMSREFTLNGYITKTKINHTMCTLSYILWGVLDHLCYIWGCSLCSTQIKYTESNMMSGWVQTSVKVASRYPNFLRRKWVWNCHLQNGNHFVSALMVFNHMSDTSHESNQDC